MTNKLKNPHFKNNAFGYTLIELVITMTIFMIFISIVAGSYTQLVRANRTANNAQKLYHSVRLIFDTVAHEVRRGKIDYTCIDTSNLGTFNAICSDNQVTQQTQKIIALLHDGDLTRTFIRFHDKQLQIGKQTRPTLRTSEWGPLTWDTLSLNEFPFTESEFRVFPTKDPYDAAYADRDEVQYQPSVGISLAVQGMTFQTTYASRSYGTRNLY